MLKQVSTTVEITIGYLTEDEKIVVLMIYNSRNYYRLLNKATMHQTAVIYNSRNYYRLLNYYYTKRKPSDLQQ